MSKFKIGDRVKITKDVYPDGSYYGACDGDIGTIVEHRFRTSSGYYDYAINFGDERDKYGVMEDYIERVSPFEGVSVGAAITETEYLNRGYAIPKPSYVYSVDAASHVNGKNIIALSKENNMSTVSKLKALNLNDADKTLRKHSITDEAGDLTRSGQDVLLAYLLEANKDGLVAKLKEIDASERADEKARKA